MNQLDRQTGFSDHAAFESTVDRQLKAADFVTASATYHDVMPAHIQALLKERESPTVRYVRTRADRIAVHKRYPIEFEWEVKTRKKTQTRYRDALIELEPLCAHMLLASLQVQCLYCFRHLGAEYDAGFWCDAVPTPTDVRIPERWTGDDYDRLYALAKRFFPNTDCNPTRWADGSSTPYVLIPEERIRVASWQKLMTARLAVFG